MFGVRFDQGIRFSEYIEFSLVDGAAVQRKLFFHVVADSPKLYSRLVNRTRAWPENFRNKLKFVQHEVGKRPTFPMC